MPRSIPALLLALGLSACVVAPVGPGPRRAPVLVAPLLTVTALRVDPYGPYGYDIVMPYTVNVGATVNVTRVCYRWPGGDPFCTSPAHLRPGRAVRARATHRHRRPQELTGWVEYESGGRKHRSNEVRMLVPPR